MAKRDPIKAALDEAVKTTAQPDRRCTLPFKDFFTQFAPAPDYQWGRHTRALINELQSAKDAVARRECYYAVISVPPRHGKSDICSRRFPAWYLASRPDDEVILCSYSGDLAEDMSLAARRCFAEAGPRFGVRLSDERNQIGAWQVRGHRGGLFAIGIGGTITGRGAHALVIDDYCKNREEAESPTVRKKVWDSFQSDLMTRLAPAHAVLVVATRWHEDDLAGRIFEEMKSNEKFPRFKHLNFPAQNDDGSFLFTERFSNLWYEAKRAMVGSYAWDSLYQGSPRPRAGRFFRADLVEIIDKLPDDLKFSRGWDLASSEKELIKDDPDFTVGTKTAFRDGFLYVADVVRGRWTATKRDAQMILAAQSDGMKVPVRIEVVAGYKDTYVRVKALLAGKALVRATTPRGDKITRASILEPVFEGAKVKILRAPWNTAWLDEFNSFPKAGHDDQVDSLVISAQPFLGPRAFGLST